MNDVIEEGLRIQLEKCENPVSFITTNSISGGTGSSFQLENQGKKEVTNICVWGQYYTNMNKY